MAHTHTPEAFHLAAKPRAPSATRTARTLPGEIHDTFGVTKGGRGTFDQVICGLG
jgi:hypothetical protein